MIDVLSAIILGTIAIYVLCVMIVVLTVMYINTKWMNELVACGVGMWVDEGGKRFFIYSPDTYDDLHKQLDKLEIENRKLRGEAPNMIGNNS